MNAVIHGDGMQYVSTRAGTPPLSASQALSAGLAADGGLFVPAPFPSLADWPEAGPANAVAGTLLAPFFHGDPLAGALQDILDQALDFPMPLVPEADDSYTLELFHGPTCAFKDVGARFLAGAMDAMQSPPRTVLVATSGDTGGAVAAAFDGHRDRVVILFPAAGVSAIQKHQLTCWSDNVLSLAVDGDFDDCQRLVKQAFVDPPLRRRHRLTSANSISIGRLLPQMSYYAAAALSLHQQGIERAGFIIPTGNLGNALAALWARRLGLPIGDIVLATNDNRVIPEYLDTGVWSPRKPTSTLANAMDVGNPSNMERLRWLYDDDVAALRHGLAARAVDDAEIEREIRTAQQDSGRIWCPHSATAAAVLRGLRSAGNRAPWVVVATAHPAKFPDIVEPLIEGPVPIPGQLARLMDRPSRYRNMAPVLADLEQALATFSEHLALN